MTANDDARIREDARDWLVRLSSGDMSAREMTAFKTWLGQSETHARAFRREKAFWQRLSHLEPVFDRLTPQNGAVPPAQHGRRWRTAPLLTALAVAACLFLIVLHPGLRYGLLADYRNGGGATMTVRLPDDSRVTLNRNSAIHLRFSAAARTVDLLQGEAFFEVRPDRERPFRVSAGNAAAEAVGTAYAVRRDGDGGRVAVTEGTVAVAAEGQTDPFAIVRAGEGVRYTSDGLLGGTFALDAGKALAWREGKVVFTNRTLKDAIAELEFYHPGRIILLGDAAAHQPISGVIDLDRLDDGIAALAATHGLSAFRVTPFLTVLR